MSIENFDNEIENIMDYIRNIHTNCKAVIKLDHAKAIDTNFRVVLTVLGETKKILLHM